MSIKSTYSIPRDVAIQAIMVSVYKLDDRALAEMLESLPESTYRNYYIADDGGGSWRHIATLSEFFGAD